MVVPREILMCVVVAVWVGRAAPHEVSAGVQFSPECGLQELKETWSVTSSVVIADDKMGEFFEPVVILETSQHEICRIDLTQCGGDLDLNATVELCVCTERTGDVYNLFARRLARAQHSERKLQAYVPFLDVFKWTMDLGVLPVVYESREDIKAYVVFDFWKQDLNYVQNYEMCGGIDYSLHVCVMNRVPGSVLTVKITTPPANANYHVELMTTQACIQYNHNYDMGGWWPHNTYYRIHVSFGESCEVCGRSGEYSFKLTEMMDCGSLACDDVLQDSCEAGNASSSRHLAQLPGMQVVLCDAEADGGGWVIIQRRVNSDVNFYRGWAQYVQGFGSLTSDFWLGLDNIWKACPQTSPCELRVDLTYEGVSYSATYVTFSLSDVTTNFSLSVTGYHGDAGDALGQLTGAKFSTRDADHSGDNCAVIHRGAWWYAEVSDGSGDVQCGSSNLNGKFAGLSESAMYWGDVTGPAHSVDSSEIKVRTCPNCQ